jgi:hypothetical protein
MAQWHAARKIRCAGGAVRYGYFRPEWLSRLLGTCRVGPIADVVLSYAEGVSEAVWESVGRLPFVRVIDARASSITDNDMSHLCCMRTVVLFDLGDTAVTDRGIRFLEDYCALELLMLDGTAITSSSLAVLSGLPRLELLFLDKTRIDDDGLEHLAAARRLRWLRLDGTRASSQAVGWLQARLPLCKVYRAAAGAEE